MNSAGRVMVRWVSTSAAGVPWKCAVMAGSEGAMVVPAMMVSMAASSSMARASGGTCERLAVGAAGWVMRAPEQGKAA